MNPRQEDITISTQSSNEDSLYPWVCAGLLTKENANKIKYDTLEFAMRTQISEYCSKSFNNDKAKSFSEMSNFQIILSNKDLILGKYYQILQAFIIQPINNEITRLECEEQLGNEKRTRLANSKKKIFVDARRELMEFITTQSVTFFVKPSHRATKQGLNDFQSHLHKSICRKISELSERKEIDKVRDKTNMFFKKILRSLLSFGGFAFISKRYQSWVFDTRSKEVVTNIKINLDNAKKKFEIK